MATYTHHYYSIKIISNIYIPVLIITIIHIERNQFQTWSYLDGVETTPASHYQLM